MYLDAEYRKDSIVGIRAENGVNVLRCETEPSRIGSIENVISILKNMRPRVAGICNSICWETLASQMRAGAETFSTSGNYDENRKKLYLDKILMNGENIILYPITGQGVNEITKILKELLDIQKNLPDFGETLSMLNVIEILSPSEPSNVSLTELPSEPTLPLKKKHKEWLKVIVERVFFSKSGRCNLQDIYNEVSESEDGKKIIRGRHENIWKPWVGSIIRELPVTATSETFIYKEPVKPSKYSERVYHVLRIMYKVDPDKTLGSGWKMRELKKHTKYDINMLNKVIRRMRYDRKLKVVGGHGKVGSPWRYAPVKFDHRDFREYSAAFITGGMK